MKRLFTLLLVALCCMAASARSYQIWVCGVQVTDANCKDVLGDGTVKYYADSFALDLINATLNPVNNYAVRCEEAKTHITIYGTCTINGSNGYAPLFLKNKFTITADNPAMDLLVVNSKNSPAIRVVGCELLLSHAKFDINGDADSMYGISGAQSSTLTINGVKMTINGPNTSYVPVNGFTKCTISECSTDAIYAGTLFKRDGEIVTKDLLFSPEEYDLWVKGNRISGLTRTKINHQNITYMPSSRTLVLGEDLDGAGNCAILAGSDISILVNGNRSVTSSNQPILLRGSNNAIYSSDTSSCLVVASKHLACAAIEFERRLEISNCHIATTGHVGTYGIKGSSSARDTLYLNSARLELNGTEGAINYIDSIKFNDCYLSKPAGYWYSPAKKVVTNLSDDVAQGIYIEAGVDCIKPILPRDPTLSASDETSNSIKVSWRKATDNMGPQNLRYVVQYQKVGWDSWVVNNPIIDANSATISYLDADSEYDIGLTVKDEAGNSVRYGKVRAKTGNQLYDVEVAGVRVTAVNYADITGDGTMWYDPLLNELVLVNAKINTATANGLKFDGKNPVTLRLCGTNTINAKSNGIYTTAPLTIKGSTDNAKLTITTENDQYKAINLFQTELTVKDCAISTVTNGNAIGAVQQDAVINFDNVDLRCELNADESKKEALHYAVSNFDNITLKNTLITSTQGGLFALHNVKINAVGTNNKVVANSHSALYLQKNTVSASMTSGVTTIAGKNGRIDFSLIGQGACIFNGHSTLEVNDVTLYAISSTGVGLSTDTDDTDSKFYVNGAKVNLRGSRAALYTASPVEFDPYTGFTTPCARIDSKIHYATSMGNVLTNLNIGSALYLDKNINASNAHNPLGDNTACYDADTKTLYLSNAKIASLKNAGIPGLTINVEGENEVKNNISLCQCTSLVGNGELTVLPDTSDVSGITVYDNLKIQDCSVSVNRNKALMGAFSAYSTLRVSNANIFLTGENGALLYGFKNITLEGCTLTQPTDAQIKNGEVVHADGSLVTDRVEIVRDELVPVSDIESDDETDNIPAFTLTGTRAAKGYKGIVIKNGKRYLMK